MAAIYKTLLNEFELDIDSSELFISGLTANRLLYSDGTLLKSTDLIDWVRGTTDQVNAIDDTKGGLTLSLPQSISTTSSPEFKGITLTNKDGILRCVAGVITDSSTTDNLPEGKTNLYYTDARARGAISGGSGISYSSLTGQILNAGVLSITGTVNQVNTNASTGNVTLSLPQSIDTSASPTFGGCSLINSSTTLPGTLSIRNSRVLQNLTGGELTTSSIYLGDGLTNCSIQTKLYDTAYADNQRLDICTNEFGTGNQIPRISVTALSGLVGISTINPSCLLDVNGATKVSSLTIGSLNGILKASSGVISGLATTSDLTEGSNLYFTTARARSSMSGGTGVTYSSADGVINIGQAVGTSSTPTFGGMTLTGLSGWVKATTGVLSATSISTTDVSEGSNLYFTQARARSSLSAGTGISYDSSTGIISNAYALPSSVTFSDVTVTDLTSSRLVYANNSKKLASVASLGTFISGTAYKVTVNDPGNGTISITLPSVVNLSYLGIDTASPSTRLHVVGSGLFDPGTTGDPTVGVIGGLGDRLILTPGTVSAYPYALGISSSTMWYSVPTSKEHRWYVGGTSMGYINGSRMVIGTDPGTTGFGKLEVSTSVSASLNSPPYTAALLDSTNQAVGTGSSLCFAGRYDGTTALTTSALIKASKSTATSGETGFDLVFATRPNGVSITEAMRILSNGRVGISTTTPAHTFDVSGTGRFTETLYVHTLDLSASGGAFTLSASQINRTDGPVNLQYNGASGVNFFANTANPIYFDSNGKVGIGVASPSEKLVVGGNVVATGVYIGDSSLNASAAIQIDSTSKGLLPPRMTTTNRGGISVVKGLVIYNTTTDSLELCDGTNWNRLIISRAPVVRTWAPSGNYTTGAANITTSFTLYQVPTVICVSIVSMASGNGVSGYSVQLKSESNSYYPYIGSTTMWFNSTNYHMTMPTAYCTFTPTYYATDYYLSIAISGSAWMNTDSRIQILICQY